MGFSIWDESNVCLDWDDTQSWFLLLGITSVPVLYDGIYDEALLRKLADSLDPSVSEGYVVRVADRIPLQFRHTVGKVCRGQSRSDSQALDARSESRSQSTCRQSITQVQ